MSKAYPIKATPKTIVFLLGAWAAVGIGPVVASRMAGAHRPELWFNVGAVLIGVLAFVPILAFVAIAIIRLTDEWNRRVGLIGYVVSFTGATLFFAAADFLKAARLIEPWAFTPVWPWLLGWFAIGLLGSAFWHQRRA